MKKRYRKSALSLLGLFTQGVAATLAVWATPALAVPPAYTLTGDYIEIGTNYLGTIGSGGSTSPGILYDNTGTGTFNTDYDYLTPGSPWEGFTVQATTGATTYTALANNTGANTSGLSGTLTNISTGSYQGVRWTGSYTPASETKLFDIVNVVGFNTGDKQITMTTTITAAPGRNLTNLYFARYTDPDCFAAVGDSSVTKNVQGTASISTSKLVYAEALASKYVLGLFSNASTNVNTGISSAWTTDPTFYYAGTNDGDGDNTIGLAYLTPTLNADGSITFTYYYIFGSDIEDAVDTIGGDLSVFSAAEAMQNSPAFGAARVIDANPDLLALFSDAGLSTDREVSDAATQTLPLLVGATPRATQNTINTVNRIIQARQDNNRGLSSGDDFYGDSHLWMKPFGAWANQQSDAGVAGFTSDTYGATFGVDGTVANNWRLGAALAYATSDVDSKDSVAQQGADIDLLELVGYGSYSLDEQTEINFIFGVGQNQVDGYRNIAFASSVAAADYDSSILFAGLGVGRTYKLTEKTSVTPSVRADYTWIKDESYTETGAGLLNLEVDDRTTDSLVIGIDGKLVHDLNEQFALTANLGVGYDALSEQDSITTTFVGAPGASFATYGIDPDPWIERGGLGAVYKTKNGIELTARYDVEFRDNFLNQAASLKARWAF